MLYCDKYSLCSQKTGEKRAVKCFNADSKSRPVETQMREFEVMRRLDHNNVVRLIDVEKEVSFVVHFVNSVILSCLILMAAKIDQVVWPI